MLVGLDSAALSSPSLRAPPRRHRRTPVPRARPTSTTADAARWLSWEQDWRSLLRGPPCEVRPRRGGAREPQTPVRRRPLLRLQGVPLQLQPLALLRLPVQRPPGKSPRPGHRRARRISSVCLV